MKKFNLHFIFATSSTSINGATFEGVDTIDGVRSWLNNCHRFVSFRNQLINLDLVQEVIITENTTEGENE